MKLPEQDETYFAEDFMADRADFMLGTGLRFRQLYGGDVGADFIADNLLSHNPQLVGTYTNSMGDVGRFVGDRQAERYLEINEASGSERRCLKQAVGQLIHWLPSDFLALDFRHKKVGIPDSHVRGIRLDRLERVRKIVDSAPTGPRLDSSQFRRHENPLTLTPAQRRRFRRFARAVLTPIQTDLSSEKYGRMIVKPSILGLEMAAPETFQERPRLKE